VNVGKLCFGRDRRVTGSTQINGRRVFSPAILQSRVPSVKEICCPVLLKDWLETFTAGLADAGQVEQHGSLALFRDLVFKELHDLIPAGEQTIDFHSGQLTSFILANSLRSHCTRFLTCAMSLCARNARVKSIIHRCQSGEIRTLVRFRRCYRLSG